MKIALGSDHAGYKLKKAILEHLIELGHDVIDCGVDEEIRVDYPDYGFAVAQKVVDGECERGLVFCGTGIGISISANKVKGIRAALVHDVNTAMLAKSHNDANVLAMGGNIVSPELAKDMVDIWLETRFEGNRHIGRLAKISHYESEEDHE